MTTAKDITRVLRVLFPHVLLSTRAAGPGEFRVKLPAASANIMTHMVWNGFMTERLGAVVTVTATRRFIRRDCGRAVEFTIKVGGDQ